MEDTALAEAMANFAVDIFRKAAEKADDHANVFISPTSITYALAMTYAGAAGDTKAQLKNILFGEAQGEKVHFTLHEIMRVLKKADAPYKLHMANRLYGHAPKAGELQKAYLELLEKHYGSKLHLVDFADTEPARQEINKYVSECTDEKIQELIAKNILSDETRLVLVNAIYFKGDWALKFEKERTTKMPFYAEADRQIQVDMMKQKPQEEFFYHDEEDCQVLGLPYEGEDLVMQVFLPKETHGLTSFEKSITGVRLLSMIRACRKEKMTTVGMPKFKMEYSLSLKEALDKLGAKDMFDPRNADFTAINGRKDLHVSEVLHKACIEVNEDGTEAAAAAAVLFMPGCAMPEYRDFIADHPFLFCVVDKRTMTILFLGRFCG